MNDGGRRGIALLADVGEALGRLTLIPVPGAGPGEAGAAPPGRIAWAYPVIGALMGAVGGVTYAVAFAVGLPALLAAVIAVGAMVALTGAAPENSLVRAAETVAGAAARRDRAGGLGTIGIITLVLALAARIGAVAALADPMTVAAALVAAAALSQAVVAASMHFVPAAEDDDGEAVEADGDKPASGYMMAAVLIAIVIAALVLPFGAGGAIVAACVGGAAAAGAALRRSRGFTQEFLGAAQQVSEIAVLVALAAVGGAD